MAWIDQRNDLNKEKVGRNFGAQNSSTQIAPWLGFLESLFKVSLGRFWKVSGQYFFWGGFHMCNKLANLNWQSSVTRNCFQSQANMNSQCQVAFVFHFKTDPSGFLFSCVALFFFFFSFFLFFSFYTVFFFFFFFSSSPISKNKL